MNKRILRKNIRREFTSSYARFLSIAILLGLGAFVLIGLKVTGQDMRNTGNQYYAEHQMADATVNATIPLNQSDQNYIKDLPHVQKIEFSTHRDAVLSGTDQSIRIQQQRNDLSKSKLVKGSMPKNSNEIALNTNSQNKYKIGDTLSVTNNDGKASISGLKHTKYKVVGFVTSSDYISKNNLGSTNMGTGTLSTFGIVNKDAFSNAKPITASIRYNNLSGHSYDTKFEKQMQANVNETKKQVADRGDFRKSQMKKNSDQKLDRAQNDLNRNQNKLNQSRNQLNNAENQLKQGKNQASQSNTQINQLPSAQRASAASQLNQQNTQLNNSQNQLNQQRTQLNRSQKQINDNQNKIDRQRNDLTQLDSINYQIQDRNASNEGYNQFGEDAKRVDALSNTFPIIFFAVAIMVSVTTMSRMAETKRTEMGTLRALGYSKFDTMKVFILYGGLSGIIGPVIGAIVGNEYLTRKIYATYVANMSVPPLQVPISYKWLIITLIISLICTIAPAIIIAARSLREMPSTLMVPKPPKAGSKVFLERIHWLWKKLSFNQKVTIRNLFRYKGRMLMTILGIFGCTALLITGFGLKDSLGNLVNNQYQNITHYDIIGLYNSNSSNANQQRYRNYVNNLKGVDNQTDIYYESNTTQAKGATNDQSISTIVPKNTQNFNQFITLKNPDTNKQEKLSNDGAIITQKLANLSGVKVGDHINVTNDSGQTKRVKIKEITQMYVGHALYMSPKYYQETFNHNQPVKYNAKMMNLSDRSNSNINKVSQRLNQQNAAVSAIQSNQSKNTMNEILSGLNSIVYIIVIVSAALSFVVLFTLTNINVSERTRELATLKVLGFYPKETIMYVYRETIILTIVGIIVGFAGGKYLHTFIMQTLPPDNVLADFTLQWTNLTTSTILTLIFSILVMLVMARKINKIDMLGALQTEE